MFCTKCGKQIPDGTVCPCEQQAQQQPQQQPQQPQQQQFQQPQQFQQQPPPQQQQFQQPPQQQQFQQQPPPQQPQQQQFQQQYQQPQQPPYYNAPPAVPADNRKLFSILAYIPLCFLFGMLSENEKNDPRVRFHVGQGIMLSIYYGACLIITIIISVILTSVWRTSTSATVWGYTYSYGSRASLGAVLIAWLLELFTWGSTAYLAITAIMNINKNQDKPLPIIGGMAFYK